MTVSILPRGACRRMPLLFLLLAGCAQSGAHPSQSAPVAQALRAQNWGDAAAAANQAADPVSVKLVAYLRLLQPGQGEAREIDDFLRDNPHWPSRATLAIREEQALAREPDDATARTLCQKVPVTGLATLLRCASALGGAGAMLPGTREVPAALRPAIRNAWRDGLDRAEDETAFLQRYGDVPGAADQQARFEHLLSHNALAAAARQVARLPAADRPEAQARLDLRRGTPDAVAEATPLARAGTPSLTLELARTLRRHDQDDQALALWQAAGFDAERAAPPELRAAFWNERSALARDMLLAGQNAPALLLADDDTLTAADPASRADSLFLGGWIALRRMNDPARAQARFAALAATGNAAITQGRAQYWLGRTAAARGDMAEARAAYTRAALYPTTFYGQLGLRALQQAARDPFAIATAQDDDLDAALRLRLSGVREPGWTQAQALAFADAELARAAAILVRWDDPRHAKGFVLRLALDAPDDTTRALAANYALRLGLPDVAVGIARLAARDGVVLPHAGWPAPYAPPTGSAGAGVPPALALGIMRQESSFDAEAVSPAGARGLMQLMPATAAQLARAAPVPASAGASALTRDPMLNMTLGDAYLGQLLSRFGGVLPYAVAAYNAGPHRVDQWVAADPQAASDPQRMIDWIETIPFNETRNYVQRVLENMGVYQAEARTALAGLPEAVGGP